MKILEIENDDVNFGNGVFRVLVTDLPYVTYYTFLYIF